MSVESRIYSPMQPLSERQLRQATEQLGMTCRLIGEDGRILKVVPSGPLYGGFVALAWPSPDQATTAAVDAVLAAGDKKAIDAIGAGGRLGWCGLQAKPFDYDELWENDPEVEEYEREIGPEKLKAIKSCRTIYWLRSGTRPKQCAELVDKLEAVLKAAAGGMTDR